MFLSSVIQTIRRHNLLVRGQHILVGVSGGADSVALLAVLRDLAPRWKLRLTVGHLNHGIRGQAAAEDAAFVAKLARRWKIPLVVGRVNVPALARRRGISLEMAGRSARYAFFARTARIHHCAVVATAHTADDQVETVLLNFARGAGMAGLAGMPYSGRHGALKVVRPLRDMDRQSIEQYLKRSHLPWREDATNADPAFLRNRVRHEILPLLEKRLNPKIRQALLRASAIMAGENEWMNILADDLLSRCRAGGAQPGLNDIRMNVRRSGPTALQSIKTMVRHGGRRAPAAGRDQGNRLVLASFGSGLDAKELAGFPLAARRRVLRRWLETCGLDMETQSFDVIERLDNLVTNPRGGRAATLPGGGLVRRDGNTLALAADSCHLLRSNSTHRNFKNALDSRLRGNDRTAAQDCHSRPDRESRKVAALLPKLTDESARPFCVRLVIPGETLLPEHGVRINASIGPGIVKERYASIGIVPARASLSLRAWRKRRLVARSWKPGDRMRPLGLKGSKKLQDIFSDGKTPGEVRHAVPIVACGGEIVWIPGYRVAQGWEVGANEPEALQLTLARM